MMYHLTAGAILGCLAAGVSLMWNVMGATLLLPQKPAPFEKLRVIVEPTTNLVTEITIYDPFGNVNKLTFTELEPGAAKDTEFFQFKTPENVREMAPPVPPSGLPQ